MVKLHEARQALATPDGLYTTSPGKEIVMPAKRSIARVCETCDQSFLAPLGEVNRGGAKYCSPTCYRARPTRSEKTIARAFVTELNARTVCAHCGSQPIEWHNPEHVELNRQHMRISQMVNHCLPLGDIKAEIARCTPLCRRCHMAEDGRLQRFVEAGGLWSHPIQRDPSTGQFLPVVVRDEGAA